MDNICYQPPVGHVDEFYMYVYDAFANNLAEGQTYLNQNIQIVGGYDFILRRIVGIDSVLAPTGQFRFRDASGGNRSNAPITCGTALRDQLIVPEMLYPETGQIAFDLYNVQKRFVFGQNANDVRIYQSQIGFGGVRRRVGGAMPTPGKYRLVPYQTTVNVYPYAQPATALAGAGATFGPQTYGYAQIGGVANSITSVQIPFNNYDVEVHMIQCADLNHNVSPNGGLGNIPQGVNFFAMIPYNAARVAITSGFVLSQFLSDGIPFGAPSVGSADLVQPATAQSAVLYKMGALVPPLLYPKETQMRLDLVCLMGVYTGTYNWQTSVPQSLAVTLTGMQRIPC